MDPPPNKLRLMLSHGGQILPRPNYTSLFYCGGETRIVAVDRRTTTNISTFVSQISASLQLNNQPFVIKYQLPHHDLDSLISVTTDDDLFIMFDEHDRLASCCSATTSPPSRLRLFLFPLMMKQQFVSAAAAVPMVNSPPDSWFSDTLKSAKIMRRKDGFIKNTAEDEKNGSSMQESVVLETSSSFGSTSSSSGSSTSTPLIGVVPLEEGVISLQDTKVKLPQSQPILSFNELPSGFSNTRIGITQDPVVDVAANPSGIASPHVELQSNIATTSSPQFYTPVQVPGYPISAHLPQHHQQMQFVQSNSQYNYPTGPFSISSSSSMYHPQLHYQTHYQPSQAYPIYLVPISQTQSYNLSVQGNVIDAGTTTTPPPPSQSLMRSNVATIPAEVSVKEVITTQPAPEYTNKVHRANPVAVPVNVSSTQNQQQLMGLLQPVNHTPPSVAIPSMETNSKFANVVDDPSYNLIYKTQPSAPTLPSQFQTATGGSALLLPEDLTKLHLNDSGQQLTT